MQKHLNSQMDSRLFFRVRIQCESEIILTSSVAFRDTVMAKYFLPPHEQVCWASSSFWTSHESSYPSYLYVYVLHRMSWLCGRLIWCSNVLDEQSCKEIHKIWSFELVTSIAVTARRLHRQKVRIFSSATCFDLRVGLLKKRMDIYSTKFGQKSNGSMYIHIRVD